MHPLVDMVKEAAFKGDNSVETAKRVFQHFINDGSIKTLTEKNLVSRSRSPCNSQHSSSSHNHISTSHLPAATHNSPALVPRSSIPLATFPSVCLTVISSQSATAQSISPSSSARSLSDPSLPAQLTPILSDPFSSGDILWYIRKANSEAKRQRNIIVFKGADVGIFEDWLEASDAVDQVPGAVYNGFSTYDQAFKAWCCALEDGYVDVLLFGESLERHLAEERAAAELENKRSL